MSNTHRERDLTRTERNAIHRLVTENCANYGSDYGCLPLDSSCYMLNKAQTGHYCRYFQTAVLPLAPALEAALTDSNITQTRPCAFCGTDFPVNGKQIYCSAACTGKARRRSQRDHMRKKRHKC